jgi:DNA (cytosine-5)-methyltransferase 1
VNYLSLFSGIGGLDLGLDRAGMTCVGQVEKDGFCQRVLAKHWREVPKHDDVHTAVDWWTAADRPDVHLVAGGYPCQPDSNAGFRRAHHDERWLWPEMARVVHAVRPRYVIGENVLGHRTRGLRFVIRDLERIGYCPHPGIVRACEMGAPHPRARVFTLAHPDSEGCGPWGRLGSSRPPALGTGWWAAEPGVARMDDRIPDRVDRRRALGNAVSPQVAEHVGRLILAHATAGAVAA